MKLENNWRQKTLENLEKEHWQDVGQESNLVKRCYELRQIPLDCFTVSDLRLMIGQQISLDYLIPMAIDVLSGDLFVRGDFFEGDLLKNVLLIDTAFWDNNKTLWTSINNLIKDNGTKIAIHKFDITNFNRSIHNPQGRRTTY